MPVEEVNDGSVRIFERKKKDVSFFWWIVQGLPG